MTEEGKKWYDDHKDVWSFKQTYDKIHRCLDCPYFKHKETDDQVWQHTAKCTYFSDDGKNVVVDGRLYLGCPSYCPLLSKDDRTEAEIRRYENYISTIEKRIEDDMAKIKTNQEKRIEDDMAKIKTYQEKVNKLKNKLKGGGKK